MRRRTTPGPDRYIEGGVVAAVAAAGAGALGILIAGLPLGIAAAVSAGINGGYGGYRGVYAWRSPKGWFAYVSDSTWGLLGTTLGNILNVANSFISNADYRPDFSQRQNRHVFERGACMKRGFAFTHGCVISNAATGRETLVEERRSFIDRHEDLHIWQNRIFGPLYQTVYVVWFLLGAIVGLTTWIIKREPPKLRRLVETAAYYDNPFEYWAYKRDEHWEDNSADPLLKWRRPAWLKRARR
jgi:hypothetical protein